MKNAILLLFLTFSFFLGQTDAFAKPNPRYASIIMDADTGIILEQQHANKSLHPASLTKIMTLLMLFEALERGDVNLNDRIRISRKAASMVPSKLGLPAGSSIRVKDAIYALVTKSANDVAVAIAEHLGRSEKGFAYLMNRKAIQIGMTRTTFKNASGLHDPRQISTARDMAKLAQYVINVYPSYYKYFSRQNFSYNGKKYRNHNRLLGTYQGMDGMKTGYISASGFNLVASAVRNNRRIIAVVFGGRTSKSRNAHMEVLLDRGFNKVRSIRIARAKVPTPARKPVMNVQIASAATTSINDFDEVMGQGDIDEAIANRFRTGLIAISAHKKLKQTPRKSVKQARVTPQIKPKMPKTSGQPWSIQIGAFENRASTDRALHASRKQLPAPYSSAFSVIAPLKTQNGWLFRARLSGYTKEEAYKACQYLKNCLPVAPHN